MGKEKTMKKLFLLFTVLLFTNIYSQKVQYPEPKESYKKVVINLPELKNEKDFKVEIFLTQNIKMKNCESGDFNVKLNQKFALPPSRFAYYEADNSYESLTYKINDDCKDEKLEKKIYNYPILESYQDRRSFIFYIPKYMNLEYRIWKVEPKFIEVK